MKYTLLLLFCIHVLMANSQKPADIYSAEDTEKPDVNINFYQADNPAIQYVSRVDFSNPKAPRFWQPGVYIRLAFKGTYCNITLNDEELYGQHNYIEIAVDDNPPVRVQTKGKKNTIKAAFGLSDSKHVLTICKNTEAAIGYLEFVGVTCSWLDNLRNTPKRKIEFIGNSITCGAGSDTAAIGCSAGKWYDQHNAYMSYGPVTARALNAQWQLSSVSGIGLIHSCCDMKITMPQVYDKMNMRNDSLPWNFSKYIPDVVTVTLGQNDGIQDSATFCGAYVDFIKVLRSKYPSVHIICLTSPMADEKLGAVLQRYLTGIVSYVNSNGDANVHKYFYSKQYNHGCGGHPTLDEHADIAKELTAYIKTVMKW